MEFNLPKVVLTYMGVRFWTCAVNKNSLFEWNPGLKEWKKRTPYPSPDGFVYFKITNPATGRQKRIQAHRAIDESFRPNDYGPGMVACHRAGHERWEYAFGCCEPGTVQDNRKHRRRDGTHSTGHNMYSYKLSPEQIRLIRYLSDIMSQVKLAKRFKVTPQAIRYHLTRNH